LNVVFNTIFTFVFHWGIFGIAFSTVLGRIGGAGLCAPEGCRARTVCAPDAGSAVVPGHDAHPYRAIFALGRSERALLRAMAGESGSVNALLVAGEH
jgi:hypothetical protein